MKEIDIRPAELMQKYIELSAQDAKLCFSDGARLDIPCIACGSKDIKLSLIHISEPTRPY